MTIATTSPTEGLKFIVPFHVLHGDHYHIFTQKVPTDPSWLTERGVEFFAADTEEDDGRWFTLTTKRPDGTPIAEIRIQPDRVDFNTAWQHLSELTRDMLSVGSADGQ